MNQDKYFSLQKNIEDSKLELYSLGIPIEESILIDQLLKIVADRLLTCWVHSLREKRGLDEKEKKETSETSS